MGGREAEFVIRVFLVPWDWGQRRGDYKRLSPMELGMRLRD